MARKDFVKIVEVGPRDGLQNVKNMVPTTVKIDLIKRLSRTGLRQIEATSFVSPKWIPQMSDANQILQAVSSFSHHGDVTYPVLVPNLKGLEEAARAGIEEISVFVAASEGFSQKNTNCSVAESLSRVRAVVEKALSQHIRVRAYVSCIFECPYDGATSPESVLKVSKSLLEMGCYEVSLGDTTGAGTSSDVRRLLTVLLRKIPASKLAGHFHDTYGQATTNVVTAYEMGLKTFDSSVSGLGGCPYSPGAKGNVATEDLVYTFDRMGVDTGIDLRKLSWIGDWISNQLGIPNGSRAGAALVAREKRDKPLPLKALNTTVEPVMEARKPQDDAKEYLVHCLGSTYRITMNLPKHGSGLPVGMLGGLTA